MKDFNGRSKQVLVPDKEWCLTLGTPVSKTNKKTKTGHPDRVVSSSQTKKIIF